MHLQFKIRMIGRWLERGSGVWTLKLCILFVDGHSASLQRLWAVPALCLLTILVHDVESGILALVTKAIRRVKVISDRLPIPCRTALPA